MRQALRAVWRNPYVRALTLLAGLVALYSFLAATREVWGIFLGAFLLAYLLYPLAAWLERRSFPRVFVLVIVMAGFLLLVGAFAGIGALVGAELPKVAPELVGVVDQLSELPFRISRFIDPSFGDLFRRVSSATEMLIERLTEGLIPSLDNDEVEGGLVNRLVALMGGGFRLTMMLVLTLYLLYRFPHYSQSLMESVPARHQPSVRELLDKISYSVGGYLRGQLMIATGVGLLSYLGLVLVGVPLAPALGVLATVLNLIPFFGPLLVSVPTALLALTVGRGTLIGAMLVLLIANQVDTHVLTPLILSRTIKIDPVTVILAILLGSSLFGLLGAVLAVPVAVFLKLLYRDYYLTSSWYHAEETKKASVPAGD